MPVRLKQASISTGPHVHLWRSAICNNSLTFKSSPSLLPITDFSPELMALLRRAVKVGAQVWVLLMLWWNICLIDCMMLAHLPIIRLFTFSITLCMPSRFCTPYFPAYCLMMIVLPLHLRDDVRYGLVGIW